VRAILLLNEARLKSSYRDRDLDAGGEYSMKSEVEISKLLQNTEMIRMEFNNFKKELLLDKRLLYLNETSETDLYPNSRYEKVLFA
jgi:hypothetical protein